MNVVRSFVLVSSVTDKKLDPSLLASSDALPHIRVSADGRACLGFALETPDAQPPAAAPGELTLVLGDASDWSDGPPACMGNAAAVRFDAARGRAEVWSSITGLPPLFAWRGAERVVVTSDLGLLARLEHLSFDPRAVVELFHLGYPAGHRSLFRDTTLVPGGHAVRVGADGRITTSRAWTLPDEAPRLDWPSYLAFQADAFRDAIRRLDLSSSLFSLTAGVDTRTILAALVSEGVVLPTATLCGPTLSLDARLAAALSQAYAFPHCAVRLDRTFLEALPTYATEASRRSGGLTSVEEAGEVFFYAQVGGRAARRLSGGFGNQVARQGFERVAPRGADLAILAADLARAGRSADVEHALEPRPTTWHELYERSLQVDGTLPSVGNAAIGQQFATQQTPYASRAMIESLGRSPVGQEPVAEFSRSRARWRDLGHRVFGEPTGRSFQRAVITQVGGPVASAPINWGWRPSGGVSLRGLALGALACLDQVASWSKPGSRGLRALLRWVGAEGLQEIKPYRAWVTDWLGTFAHDTLLSREVKESGVFDNAALARVLREHYAQKMDRTATIIAALDLALAQQLFCRHARTTRSRAGTATAPR